jgi:hypothetical protein
MNRTFGVWALMTMMAQQTPQPPQLDPNNFGVIRGAVVDPQGRPVEGARVNAVGSAESEGPMGGRWPPGTATTTDSEGNFVLDRVAPDKKVSIYASKEGDYYEDFTNPFIFNWPKNLKIPVVEVKAGQTVTGVRIQLTQKVGKLHLYVRDADTKELVHGIFSEWCRKGVSAKYCLHMSGPSDYERNMSLGMGIAIQIEADDGLHEKSEYRNPKTGSRYFRAKSGKTETVNVYLRKK